MYTKNNRFQRLFIVLVLTLMLIPAPAVQAASHVAAPSPAGETYIVVANDTLWAIAARYGITVAQITAANPNVNPNALRPGQTLAIPTNAAAISVASYTVKPGDSLWTVASRYGLFVSDLLAANPGVNPQRLQVGQILHLPDRAGNPTAPLAPVSATYAVRPDDTLWDIAANYGLSVADLLTANPGVDPRRLMVGQQLSIPGITQDALTAALVAQQPATTDVPAVENPEAEPTASSEQAAPAEPAPTAAPEGEPGPVPTIDPLALDMLNRINEKRLAGGRSALIWNEQLAAAAQAHAEDCAARNRGSHVGSDGARLAARLQRVGYAATWAGENWANARDVARAMAIWWNEPPGADPHVQNIMASRATEIGIGVARGAWGIYFIADFGSR